MAGGAFRFKRDLRATPVQDGAYRFFEVVKDDGDPIRLYDFEYNLAMELDGRPVADVAASAKAKHGLDLNAQQVHDFARSLGELGLLHPVGEPGTNDGAATPAAREADAPRQGAWHRDQSEPTTLMDGTADMAKLLALASTPTGETAAVDSETVAPVASDPIDEDAVEQSADLSAAADTDSSTAREPGMVTGNRDDVITKPESLHRHDDGRVHNAVATPDSLTAQAAPPQPIAAQETPVQETLVIEGMPRPVPSDTATDPMKALDVNTHPDDVTIDPDDLATRTPRAAKPAKRGRLLLWAVLGIVLALALAGLAVYKLVLLPGHRPVSVRTVQPSPVSVYRWFDTEGQIHKAPPQELALESTGKLIEIRPAGTRFSRDDVLALLEAGKPLRAQLLHHRERLAFYQQMFESMKAEGNRAEMRQAEIKMAEKNQLIEETRTALARVAIVADRDGEIAETLVEAETRVNADTPVLRLAGSRYHAIFDFPRDEAAHAGRLTFCRVLVADDRPVDCTFAPSDGRDGDQDRLVVALDDRATVVPGQAVRLARTRFDAVFAVPASALIPVGDGDRLFVASPSGRAEMRAVLLAERTGEEVIITQGLDMGDDVIVDVPSALAPNVRVSISERRMQ